MLSYFLSQILRPHNEMSLGVFDSIEVLLSRVNECNCYLVVSNYMMGRMYVESLYPSIGIVLAVERYMEK